LEQSSEVFVQPNLRGEAAGALAAAVLAASVAGATPAVASPTISVFGFGISGGTAVSDAYNLNDADAISPYSQFSNPKEATYKPGNSDAVARKKVYLQGAFKALESIPELIKVKHAEEIKSVLTGQLKQLKPSLIYLSGETFSPTWQQAKAVGQAVSDLGVAARAKRWDLAEQYYATTQAEVTKWKQLANFDSLTEVISANTYGSKPLPTP